MREIISDKDIGSTIDFRTIGPYEAQHPWPAETIVSAGRGVVYKRGADGSNQSYQSLFMEVYPPGAAFIRGEGLTPEDCENACWHKYQLALHCIDENTEHVWEPRHYNNGAGFCKHCNTFKSGAFTATELNQFCAVCQVPTFWSLRKDDNGVLQRLCEEHAPKSRLFADDDEDNEPVAVTEASLKAVFAALMNEPTDTTEPTDP